jgi:epoxyqueuosine reductase QueG
MLYQAVQNGSNQGFLKKTRATSFINYIAKYSTQKHGARIFSPKKGYDSVVTRKIGLKPAAVQAGLGSRGKNTLVVSPEHGSRVRFAAVITTAELDPDLPYTKDLCGDCIRCLVAFPTKALKPYKIDIRHCLTYAAENARACTICQDVCPIGVPLVK